jgi:hypothetical protein
MSVCLRVYPCVRCMSVITINTDLKIVYLHNATVCYVLYVKLLLKRFMYMFNCMQFTMYVCMCVCICI